MDSKYAVNQEIINWLLEDGNPPVRYLTSIELLGETDISKLEKIKNTINTYKPIQEILNNQKEDGYWVSEFHNYLLYQGTYWQLQFLTNLYAQRSPQIEKAINHIFKIGQAEEGGFIYGNPKFKGRLFICLAASMMEAFIHFGFLNDNRAQRTLEFILSSFVDSGGEIRCFVRGLIPHCYMVLPQILRTLSSIPKSSRSIRVTKGIQLCINRLLENNIYKFLPEKNKEFKDATKKLKGQIHLDAKNQFLKNNPALEKVEKKGWKKFKFPHSYTSDILSAMYSFALADVSYDPRMKDALDVIKSSIHEGKWINWQNFKSPTYTVIEGYKQPSKWLTLKALVILKFYEGITIVS